ncbi:hypothetical protein RhiirA5_430586 [Rhizophagus irregularis]|uniref:Uncharacterized protein n=1 Tax=Rhizophagus irregularis TaxID=588596 RepID=A0A2N0NWG3_9GLOM|nr:hypothetical protein RhiirA5_430586 [Rhizophagus irregularis]
MRKCIVATGYNEPSVPGGLVRGWPIKNQIINGEIDWSFTKEWLNHNPLDIPCSAKLSKIQGTKIKRCSFIVYPTVDIQQRNYPRLYPLGHIPCMECQRVQDSNAHIGTCTEHSDDIKLLLHAERDRLISIIKENLEKISDNLEDTINRSSFFNINFDDTLPDFMKQIDALIWKRRATQVKLWERSISITKNKKRFYHRQRKRNRLDPSTGGHLDPPPRRSYTHRRLNITPYFREGVSMIIMHILGGLPARNRRTLGGLVVSDRIAFDSFNMLSFSLYPGFRYKQVRYLPVATVIKLVKDHSNCHMLLPKLDGTFTTNVDEGEMIKFCKNNSLLQLWVYL